MVNVMPRNVWISNSRIGRYLSELFGNQGERLAFVIVAMNSDEWIFRQKGFNSIGFKERKEFLMSIKGVVDVVSVNDEDGTVCTALIEHRPIVTGKQ